MLIDGQGRHQQQGQLLRHEGRARRGQNTTRIRLQRLPRAPGAIQQTAIGHGRQRQRPLATLQPGAQIRLIGQGPAQAQMLSGPWQSCSAQQQGVQISGTQLIQALLQCRAVPLAQGPEPGAQLLFAHR